MKSRMLGSLLVVAGLLLTSGSLHAHHGGAEYDRSKSLSLKGTITEFRFINPHVLFEFEAKDDQGNVEKWQGEVSNPLQLTRQGWNRKTFWPDRGHFHRQSCEERRQVDVGSTELSCPMGKTRDSFTIPIEFCDRHSALSHWHSEMPATRFRAKRENSQVAKQEFLNHEKSS